MRGKQSTKRICAIHYNLLSVCIGLSAYLHEMSDCHKWYQSQTSIFDPSLVVRSIFFSCS